MTDKRPPGGDRGYQPTKQAPSKGGYAQDGYTPTKSGGKIPAPPPKKP